MEKTNSEWLSRTELMLGSKDLEKLKKANVLVVGLGGVGGYAAELICRAGIGRMTIIDGDRVDITNKNRQLAALDCNIGLQKTEVIGERLKEINPELDLKIITEFIRDERMKEILEEKFDYVVDAIDTISPKLFLILHSLKNKYNIISSMGAGGKLDPSQVQIADISKSYKCKLASTIRRRLHKLKVYEGFKVIFSPESVPKEAVLLTENEDNKKSTVGTISYMPPIFGCFMASVVVRDLIEGVRSKGLPDREELSFLH